MHTDLARQQAEGVLAIDAEGGGLDAGFFRGLIVVENRLEPPPLRPAQVHAQKHVGPILGIDTACARVDGDDGIARVVLAREQGLGFEPID